SAGEGQVKIKEAVEHSQLPSILQRPEPVRRVPRKIGHRHLPRQNERHRASKQPEKNEQAAEEFQCPGYSRHREHRRPPAWYAAQEAEEFLRAVLHVKKASNDTQDAEQTRRPLVVERIEFNHMVLQ